MAPAWPTVGLKVVDDVARSRRNSRVHRNAVDHQSVVERMRIIIILRMTYLYCIYVRRLRLSLSAVRTTVAEKMCVDEMRVHTNLTLLMY